MQDKCQKHAELVKTQQRLEDWARTISGEKKKRERERERERERDREIERERDLSGITGKSRAGKMKVVQRKMGLGWTNVWGSQ